LRRFFTVLQIAALLLLLSGCVNQPLPSTEYSAVIENIEDVPGQHYSPAGDQEPLYAFDLRIINPRKHESRLRLLVLGLSRAERLGITGDKVSFRITGPFPVNEELWLDQLTEYRVLNGTEK